MLKSRLNATDQVFKPHTAQVSSLEIKKGVSSSRRQSTRNQKFEAFLDRIFASKLKACDAKDEVIKYVQLIETSYTEVVRDLRDKIEQLKVQLKLQISSGVNQNVERNELETLFL